MSKGLVKRWRKIAGEWDQAADNLEPRRRRGDPREPASVVAEQVDCRARADVLRDCAKSLELSIQRAERRKEKPHA